MRFSFSLSIAILWIIFSAGTCLSPNSKIDDNASTSIYAACMPITDTKDDLEIVTFNMENFPKNGDATIEATALLFRSINADVYALQEIKSRDRLNELVDRLNGYSCIFYPKKSDLALAFLYKESEVSVYNNETELLFNNSYYFPRPAFKIKIHHKSLNKDIYLINNHLKCCNEGDSKERRAEASNMLKDYIDTFLDDEAVIVLGDFNDKITGNENQIPFSNFINDPNNYTFTDMMIAQGPRSGWSYPSYPSHIDHILVTDELFENIDDVSVFNMTLCIDNFSRVISDHRPLGIIFKNR
ncbi:MAG: endonuclease/exonuclease/phosphatase family protein [Bacteroidales bacterium]|nr:endonuclease/exonuclease/phosphatase family protein [Bacteroidales bacterium]